MHHSSPPQNRMQAVSIYSSATSSSETIGPITPLDADELFIDQLWEQVRSRSKSSVDISGPVEKAKIKREPFIDRGPVKEQKQAVPRLTRRPSLVFKESPDGRNTIVILSLPGVQKSDVHVSYQHRRLIVSYKSVEETERWEHDKVIQETKEKRCVRAIPLPDIIRPEHVRASMSEHRLFISHPKCE